jgi:hypothetical protein
MKGALKVASILTWFNLIFWGFVTVIALLGAVVLGPIALVLAVFLSAIPLNCYAALQLHKSIRQPVVKLSHQTPVGIRFIGYVSLFYGLTMVSSELSNLQNPGKSLQLMKDAFTGLKSLETMTVSMVRASAVIGLILGLAVVVNVILNFRLLRWYYLVHQSDAS